MHIKATLLRRHTAALFLLSYLMVMLVPLCVLLGYDYPRMRQMLVTNATQRAVHAVEEICSGTDIQLQTLYDVPNQIFEDDQLILRGQTGDPLTWYNARKCLSRITRSSAAIRETFLYLHENDYLISSSSGSLTLSNIDDYSGIYQTSFSNWSAHETRRRLTGAQKLTVLPACTCVLGGASYPDMLLLIAPVPSGRFALATALICVPMENLLKCTGASTLETTELAYFLEDETLLYSTCFIDDADREALLHTMNENGASSGSAQQTLSSGEYILAWHSSPLYGWRYVQLVPMDSILQEAARLQRDVLTLILVASGICFLLILAAMKMNYLPLRRLAKLAQKDDATPRDDFQAIQRLITGLTHANDQLGRRLTVSEPQARQHVISTLLNQTGPQLQSALQRAALLGIQLNASAYQVVLIEYESEQQAQSAVSAFNDEVLQQENVIAAQLDGARLAAVILNADLTEDSWFESACTQSLRLVAGMRVQDAAQLGQAYATACAVLDYQRNAQNPQKLMRYDDLPDRVFNPHSYPLEVMQSLEAAITHSNVQRFDALISQIVSLMLIEGAPPYFIRSVYFNTINLLISGLSLHLGAGNEAIGQLGAHSMLTHPTVMEMVKILRATADELSRLMAQQSEQASPIASALDFIDQSLSSSSLCLAQVADHAGMSTSAFSRSFKEKVGRNFKEYVDAARLLRAQKLLEDTQLPIESVAEQVGYDTLTSFYRLFRKYTGEAPGQYRQGHQLKKESFAPFAPEKASETKKENP